MRSLLFALALVSLLGCDRRKGPAADQMKKADDWGSGAAEDNPHAGADMNDPHAGVDMNDPHAGVDPNDPHAGVDMSGPGGLPAPDPDRPIDPTKYIRGTIELGAATKGKAPATGVVFLAVRPADAQGNPAGPPLAVDVVQPGTFPMKFELTEAQAMIGGTAFSGNVVVTARFDQDQDVDSRQAGDLSGKVAAKIPSDGVKLTLDTVQP